MIMRMKYVFGSENLVNQHLKVSAVGSPLETFPPIGAVSTALVGERLIYGR